MPSSSARGARRRASLQPCSDRFHLGQVPHGQQDQELVAADAPDEVAVPQAGL